MKTVQQGNIYYLSFRSYNFSSKSAHILVIFSKAGPEIDLTHLQILEETLLRIQIQIQQQVFLVLQLFSFATPTASWSSKSPCCYLKGVELRQKFALGVIFLLSTKLLLIFPTQMGSRTGLVVRVLIQGLFCCFSTTSLLLISASLSLVLSSLLPMSF